MGKLNLTVIEIKHATMKFAAAHFTIFSSTDREPLHGHNYTVEVCLTTTKPVHGLNFDYRFYREIIVKLCLSLDKQCLLPKNSPYLLIEENEAHVNCTFNHEKMSLLKHDVKLMPIQNITIEELSSWFLDQLLSEQDHINSDCINNITVKVNNSPYQSGIVQWER